MSSQCQVENTSFHLNTRKSKIGLSQCLGGGVLESVCLSQKQSHPSLQVPESLADKWQFLSRPTSKKKISTVLQQLAGVSYKVGIRG